MMVKVLWNPWRMEHVTGAAPDPGGCLFDPPGRGSWDRKQLLLYRDRLVLVLLNRYPYANGHLLLAPVRHVGELSALGPQENLALMTMLQHCSRILSDRLRPDGFNIGINLGRAAGAGIDDHLHIHVVPRWEGDHNFMTVTAEIRTIPQHIEATYAMLLPDFQLLAPPEEKNE
jgi:ATP adenylyltransferase